MAEPIAVAALALEAAIGWPDALYRRVGHPVGFFARALGAAERRWNDPARNEANRRVLGVLTIAGLLVATGVAAWLVERLAHAMLGRWAWPLIVLLTVPALAQRSLHDHVAPIAAALRADDLPAARTLVARIVGRDTGGLDEAGVARAAIESLAESFCDGIAAPTFWLLLAGLPGLWAYKALNTADSLIGHREPRWRAFGWASARGDDVANWIPARLAGALICATGGGGWRIMLRDARRHASPNAGWPEAAMAGALGLRLAGPIAYEGVVHAKPWIGGGSMAARPSDIGKALAIYRRACLGLWLIAGAVAWLR